MPAPQTLTRSSCDALSQHLRSIGRIPLLSSAEEITLGKAVQALRALEEVAEELRLRSGGVAPSLDTWAAEAGLSSQQLRRRRRLGERARIGTVDKFQGQEAPVAIHSLTASDGDAAPRGLGFLLDPNRLNVAISRAQCLSIVVGSAALSTGISRSVEEVHQLSRLCRLIEIGR